MRGRGALAHLDGAAWQRLGGDERRVALVLVRVQEVVGEHAVEAVGRRRPGLHEPARRRQRCSLARARRARARRAGRRLRSARRSLCPRACGRHRPSAPSTSRAWRSRPRPGRRCRPADPLRAARSATRRRDVAGVVLRGRQRRARDRRCSPGRRGCAGGPGHWRRSRAGRSKRSGGLPVSGLPHAFGVCAGAGERCASASRTTAPATTSEHAIATARRRGSTGSAE